MNRLTKLLLTIPSIVGIIYLITFWNVDFFKWITNNVIAFEYQKLILNGIILPQLGYLIYRVWNFKNLKKDKKILWTFLLLAFNSISSLIYIWKKDDNFITMNKNTVHNNAQKKLRNIND